jgi:hypothetical protein
MNLIQHEFVVRKKGLDVAIFIDKYPQTGDSTLIVALKCCDLVNLDRLSTDGVLREAIDANGYTPLMIASHFGLLSAVTILLRHRANLEAKTVRSWTALSMAISARKVEVMTTLLNFV